MANIGKRQIKTVIWMNSLLNPFPFHYEQINDFYEKRCLDYIYEFSKK